MSSLRTAFDHDGYVVLRNFAPPDIGDAMEREIIAAIRAAPPSAHSGKPAYRAGGELIIQPESKPDARARNAEDFIAKVFNPHLEGAAKTFAHSAPVGDAAREILGDDVEVFQSQFIFKNPGAWGQPWHQDSFYFPFDRGPQLGVWLAISEATLDNGCLSVLPGSHMHGIHHHGADRRDGANQGYTEVTGVDFSHAIPMLMEPGDVLFFHSHLLHRSEDNRAQTRRSAMVYHYAHAGTRPATQLAPIQEKILRFVPV